MPRISVAIIDHYKDPLNLIGLLRYIIYTCSLPDALIEIWLAIEFIEEVIILVFSIPMMLVFWYNCRSLGKFRENMRVMEESTLIKETSYVILKIVWTANVVIVFNTVKLCWFCINWIEVLPEPISRLFILLRLNDIKACLAERWLETLKDTQNTPWFNTADEVKYSLPLVHDTFESTRLLIKPKDEHQRLPKSKVITLDIPLEIV